MNQLNRFIHICIKASLFAHTDFTVGSGPARWTDTFIGTWSIDTLRSVLTGPNNQTLVDFYNNNLLLYEQNLLICDKPH